MKTRSLKITSLMTIILSCVCLFGIHAAAESYTASTMRLLRYEGDVEILDEDGESRFILENARFNSGETLSTGEDGTASVELDEERIVTLDSLTSVEFVQKGDAMKMTLQEGTILLDVARSLNENETLDIQTSNMTVGIRGTIVYLTSLPADDERLSEQSESTLSQVLPFLEAAEGAAESNHAYAEAPDRAGADRNVTVFGVLEGTAAITWTDTDGAQKSIDIEAGQKALIMEDPASGTAAGPVVSPMEQADIRPFMEKQLAEEVSRPISPLPAQGGGTDLYGYSSTDDWTYCGLVMLVAQSASKIYDGTALTGKDITVYGLPEGFAIQAQTGGSQTDAGTCGNPITSYSIRNAMGEDVTSHFVNMQTTAGLLVVDPAPLTVSTNSAQKVYDGTPLTNTEAQLSGYSGMREVRKGQNISYIDTQPFDAAAESGSVLNGAGGASDEKDSQVLYGIVGEVMVHAVNPLTGETMEISLHAGQKLTIRVIEPEEGAQDKESKDDQESRVDFEVTEMTEEEIPDTVLRLYADNPDVLAQACQDTGWDIEKIQKRIEDLPETDEDLTEENGVLVREDAAGSTVQDYSGVRINIDSNLTNYHGRSLEASEASFVPVQLDPSIKAVAAGSQTSVGSSMNTAQIDWGQAKPENYIVSEVLGTLTVTPAAAVITTGSAQKVYDGTALTSSECSITGLAAGETAQVIATGSQTQAGSSPNTYTITWGSANPGNYTITEHLGTLTVTQPQTEPETEPQTEPETEPQTEKRTATATVTTGSATKTYDGKALTDASASITGLKKGDTATVKATGSQTDAGSSVNTYTIEWGKNNAYEYTVKEDLGTLKVTPLPVTFDLTCYEAVYSGLNYLPDGITGIYEDESEVTRESIDIPVEEEPDADPESIIAVFSLKGGASVTLTCRGFADAGTYTITPEVEFTKGKEDNYEFTFENDQMIITPAPLTVTTQGATKVYDGSALTNPEASITGLQNDETAVITATGSIVEIGTAVNTYTISWEGTAKESNYEITQENLGTLEVRAKPVVTFHIGSISREYNGLPLSDTGAITVEGLPEGYSYAIAGGFITGSQNGVGSSAITYDQNALFVGDADGLKADVEIVVDAGTRTVTPCEVTFDLAGYETTYEEYSSYICYSIAGVFDASGSAVDGDYRTHTSAYTDGTFKLMGEDQITINVVSLHPDGPGKYDFTPQVEFASGSASNYNIKFKNQTVTLTGDESTSLAPVDAGAAPEQVDDAAAKNKKQAKAKKPAQTEKQTQAVTEAAASTETEAETKPEPETQAATEAETQTSTATEKVPELQMKTIEETEARQEPTPETQTETAAEAVPPADAKADAQKTTEP